MGPPGLNATAEQESQTQPEGVRLDCRRRCKIQKSDDTDARGMEPKDGRLSNDVSNPTSPSESSDATEEDEDGRRGITGMHSGGTGSDVDNGGGFFPDSPLRKTEHRCVSCIGGPSILPRTLSRQRTTSPDIGKVDRVLNDYSSYSDPGRRH